MHSSACGAAALMVLRNFSIAAALVFTQGSEVLVDGSGFSRHVVSLPRVGIVASTSASRSKLMRHAFLHPRLERRVRASFDG